jgi:hypothetical protein
MLYVYNKAYWTPNDTRCIEEVLSQNLVHLHLPTQQRYVLFT